MKLHYNTASPYARKVVVVAHETGLFERIELMARTATPVAPSDELNRDNPLGKLPCLITEAGEPLYDSRVIAEFLDALHEGPRIFPVERPARWTALRRQALGDGILDAGVGTRYETFIRPAAKQWDEWVRGQKLKISRALDALEGEAETFGDAVDIGTITIGCALGYLDFRFNDDRWRDGRPDLARWFDEFGARPAMAATVPS
ncbi:MAG TPA: glutathione S-transferase [Geminicoccaceae bacterium]